jgi:hypothetical protein
LLSFEKDNEFNEIDRYNIDVASAPRVPNQGFCAPFLNYALTPRNDFSNNCNVSSGDLNVTSQINNLIYTDNSNLLPQCKSSNVSTNGCYELILECEDNFSTGGVIYEFPYETVSVQEANMSAFSLVTDATFDNTNYTADLFEENPDEETITKRFLLAERNITYQKLASLITDSLGILAAIDYLMEQDNEDAMRVALPYLINAGIYTQARAIVNALPSNISYFEDMKDWYGFILDKREADSLEYEDVQYADSLFIHQMATTPGIMQGKAKALYYFLYGMPFPHIEGLFGDPVNKRSIRRQINLTKDISVYPNPAKDDFYIEVDFEGHITHASVELKSLMGVKILQQDVKTNGKHRFHLKATDVPAGVYLLILQTDKGEMETRRVIIN